MDTVPKSKSSNGKKLFCSGVSAKDLSEKVCDMSGE